MSLPDDPACNEIVEIVTAYLEGALPASHLAAFERHLGECSACLVYVEQVRETIRLTGRLAAPPLSPRERDAFVGLLRGWKGGGKQPA